MATFGRPVVVQAAAVEHTATEAAQDAGRRKSSDSPFADPNESRLWDYWEQLGVISFPVQVMANVASLVSFYPAEVPDSDEVEPERTENAQVLAIWDDLGGAEKFADWVSQLVMHYWVPGRAWLAATRTTADRRIVLADPDDTDAEWLVLSTEDLMDAGGFKKRSEIPAGDVRFYQLYKPSPRRRKRADSPVRHAAEDCELLLTYRHDLRAHAVSRAAAGIMPLPGHLQKHRLSNGKLWGEQLLDDMRTARNTDDPASTYPLLAFVKDKDDAEILSMGPTKLADPGSTSDLLDKIEAAVRSVAVTLDMPAEFLLGMGGLNHWSAWLIQRQNYDYHLDPLVVRICRDLTIWFRSYLSAAGVADADRFVLWRNPESAISNPNQWEQVRWLYEQFLISGDAAREFADVGKVDAPDMDELRQRILLAALATPLALANVPSLATDTELVPNSGGTGVGSTPATPNPADSNDMPDSAPPPMLQAATQTELDRIARRLAMVDQTLIAEVESSVAREAERLLRNLQQRVGAAARAAGVTESKDDESIAEELGVTALLVLLAVASVDDLVDINTVRLSHIESAIERAQSATDDLIARAGGSRVDAGVRSADRDLAATSLRRSIASAVGSALFRRPTPEGEAGRDIVAFADVRRALDQAGGGGAARAADEAWELVANGRHTVESLDVVGIRSQAFQWVYGTTPRNTFEPHLRLDGAVFTRWDDPTLDQSGTGGEWVGGTHYYPGDHRGCRCTYQRVLVDASGVVSIAAAAGRRR